MNGIIIGFTLARSLLYNIERKKIDVFFANVKKKIGLKNSYEQKEDGDIHEKALLKKQRLDRGNMGRERWHFPEYPLLTINSLEPGDHLCCIYDAEEQHRAVLAPFMRHGLERNEKVLYIVDTRTAETILNYLREKPKRKKSTGKPDTSKKYFDLDSFLAKGQLQILTVRDAYLRNGVFDPRGMISLLESETSKALSEGYAALRVTGEMTWVLKGDPGSERLIEYEYLLNDFFPGSKCLSICQYDRRRFAPEILLAILDTHPIVVIGTTVYNNFYYMPPNELHLTHRQESELRHRIHNIAEWSIRDARLTESERRFWMTFENSPTGMMLTAPGGNILQVNNAFCRMTGYTYEELTAIDIPDITHSEDRDLNRRYADMLLEGKCDHVQFEKRYIRKDGTIVWVSIGSSLLRDAAENPIYFATQVQDITERKRAEEALGASEEKYHSLVENLNDVIFNLDEQGNITYMNPVVENIFGYRAEEILGRSFSEYIHPDDLPGLMESRKETLKGVLHPYEFRIVDKHGSIHHVRTSSRPIERDGKHVGMTGILTDITGEMRSREALRDSEEKYRNLFQTSRDFICITDFEGSIIDTNHIALEFFGYSVEELSNMRMHDLYTNLEDRQKLMNRIFESGYVTNHEVKLKKKSGEVIDVLMTASLRRDKHGNPIGFFGSAKDITEKKRMEMQLLQTEKLSAIGTMISGVAHEINNPLMSIIGNVQLLEKRDVPVDVRDKLNIILKESIRSSKIVGGLLTFAREHEPERMMTNINDILMESVKLREYDLKVSNIDVRTSLSDDLPETYADPYQIQQVFINLINNARDALADQDGGAFVMRTRIKGNSILVDFEDNGPGIPGELINKLFDPFFTTKEIGKGTGLGLSIAYGIIKEHGGTISVESKPGKGAKFVVTIPITESAELVAEKVKAPVKLPPGSRTVLVIEDEASLRDLLSEALTKNGFLVEVASSGEKAASLLGTRKYDVVISDIKMPGIGGKELYLYIQKHHPEIAEKIIFITGDILGRDTRSFLQITNNRFIEKPFNLNALVEMVNDVLSK